MQIYTYRSALLSLWTAVTLTALMSTLCGCQGELRPNNGTDAGDASADITQPPEDRPAFDAPSTLDRAPNCLGDLQTLQDEVLVPRCTNGRCHGSARPAAGLDLASANLEQRLVNVAAMACPMQTLVVPNDLARSYLYAKLIEPAPSCGPRMPLGMAPLSPAELQCVSRWIASLTVPDGGAGPDATDAADATADAPTCPAGQDRCAGLCVDRQSDNSNCGMCGVTCNGGSVCAAGACRCGPMQTLCGGRCVNVNSDNDNCGACGNQCLIMSGQRCNSGSCACQGLLRSCGGRCVDTQSDMQHCGQCNNGCAAGFVCSSGMCTRVCAMGTTNCGGSCVDLMSAVEHCGACNNRCAAGLVCNAGACACPAGTTRCGATCVNPMNDSSNCGGCGVVCGAGRACSAGRCECAAPTIECGGSCVDPRSNSSHCGACNSRCAVGAMCAASSCVCPGSQRVCAGSCTDVQTDSFNCGMCGTFCGRNQTCVAGACACPAGQSFCGGECVGTADNDSHCGMCGRACGAGTLCIAGSCQPCGAAVSYMAAVAPRLSDSCTAGCHSGAFPSAGLDLTPAAARGALVGQRANGCAMRMRVVAGDAANSDLVHKLTGAGLCGGSRMPLFGAPWADADINVIRRWICQGAPNN